jgi:hypothetical protein
MEFSAKLQSMDVPSHFIAGSYHELAESVALGWHPRYRELLASNVTDEGDDDGAAD